MFVSQARLVLPARCSSTKYIYIALSLQLKRESISILTEAFLKKLIEIEQVQKCGRQVVLSVCTCSIEIMCADRDVCETWGLTEYRKLPVISSDPHIPIIP